MECSVLKKRILWQMFLLEIKCFLILGVGWWQEMEVEKFVSSLPWSHSVLVVVDPSVAMVPVRQSSF